MPSDADQIRDLEAELDALDNPTTAEVLSHTQDYDAGIVAAIGVQRGTTGGDGGSQPILLASVSVNSAEILALHTTAKELLAAPSGRNYYLLHKIVCHYRFVTTPYSETAEGMAIGFGSTVAEIIDNTALTGSGYVWPLYVFGPKSLLKQTEDAYAEAIPNPLINDNVSWIASVNEGKALSLASSDPFTVGDGTLTVRLFYSVIDGAS